MLPPSSSPLPTVAIAGAKGHLGQHIAAAFFSPQFRSNFSEIILLTRQAPSPTSQLTKWEKENGATISVYDESDLSATLKHVDILVNAIGPPGHAFRDRLLRALPNTTVSLYFPSEFGVDHTIHDFTQPEFDRKKQHVALAAEVAPKVQICRVFCGLALEDSIGLRRPFGFDTKSGKYESIGSSKSGVAYTALPDIGKSVASIASLPREKIPTNIHISGDVASMSDVAEKMRAAGAGEIAVAEIDFASFKAATIREENSPNPAKHLRFLMGEGLIDHSPQGLGNDNELVNPGEKLWRWITVNDFARDSGGKPWADMRGKETQWDYIWGRV